MNKKELKDAIFLLLHDKRLLTKITLPIPKDQNIISSYYAEVMDVTLRLDVKHNTVRILNYEVGNDISKYTLEDIYKHLNN